MFYNFMSVFGLCALAMLAWSLQILPRRTRVLAFASIFLTCTLVLMSSGIFGANLAHANSIIHEATETPIPTNLPPPWQTNCPTDGQPGVYFYSKPYLGGACFFTVVDVPDFSMTILASTWTDKSKPIIGSLKIIDEGKWEVFLFPKANWEGPFRSIKERVMDLTGSIYFSAQVGDQMHQPPIVDSPTPTPRHRQLPTNLPPNTPPPPYPSATPLPVAYHAFGHLSVGPYWCPKQNFWYKSCNAPKELPLLVNDLAIAHQDTDIGLDVRFGIECGVPVLVAVDVNESNDCRGNDHFTPNRFYSVCLPIGMRMPPPPPPCIPGITCLP